MIVIHMLLAIAGAYFVVVAFYLIVVTLAAHVPRKQSAGDVSLPSFAIVVPAHNEASEIDHAIAAIHQLDYPQGRFNVFVIADNCDDDTAKVARHAGAAVFERHDPGKRGKGQALDWFFTNHPEILEAHKAVAVVDADSAVGPGFLRAVAATFVGSDAAAVQGYYAVANPNVNWRTGLTYAGFALINAVRPAGRTALGGCAALTGSGMAFRSTVLAKYGWPAYSIVEDIEFGARLLLAGERVDFSRDARVFSEMPSSRRQADGQRRRWESGRLRIARRFVPRLLWAFLMKRKWYCLDAALDLAVPPLSLLVAAQGFLLILGLLVHPLWAGVFGVSLVATALHVVLGLRLAHAPWQVWTALVAAPAFIAWKLVIHAKMLVLPQDKGWVRTPRQAEMNGENRS